MSKGSASLGHVGISVTDMDKMLDFYTRVLGLTVTDGGGPGARGVFLSADPHANTTSSCSAYDRATTRMRSRSRSPSDRWTTCASCTTPFAITRDARSNAW